MYNGDEEIFYYAEKTASAPKCYNKIDRKLEEEKKKIN